MIKPLLIGLILLTSCEAPAKRAATLVTIPVAFRGNWALESRACAPGPADSGNMRITADHLYNFESEGRFVRIQVLDPRTVRVESRFTHNGGTYGNTDMMTLSVDKQQLFIGEMSDLSIYKRCGK
jgi:hypothetical protein